MLPLPYCHTAKVLFTRVFFFTQYILSDFNKKLQGILKGTKTHFEETEHGSEQESDIACMLELSDQEYKTTMISMLRALIGKVDNMQEQMDNVNGEMEILRKNQIEMLEIKKYCNGNEKK